MPVPPPHFRFLIENNACLVAEGFCVGGDGLFGVKDRLPGLEGEGEAQDESEEHAPSDSEGSFAAWG